MRYLCPFCRWGNRSVERLCNTPGPIARKCQTMMHTQAIWLQSACFSPQNPSAAWIWLMAQHFVTSDRWVREEDLRRRKKDQAEGGWVAQLLWSHLLNEWKNGALCPLQWPPASLKPHKVLPREWSPEVLLPTRPSRFRLGSSSRCYK